MKRTSAAVLALLFTSCNAIKLNKEEESEPVPSPQAEKVHVLDLGMHTMSNSPKDFPEQAFPNVRTAFYAQTGSELTYDHQNGLWLTQKAGEYDTTAVKGPPEGQIGDVVYEHGMNATDGIPGDRSKSLGPSFAQREHKVDPISPENYDPWVYQTSKENMGNFPQWHWEGKGGKDNLAQQKHHHHHNNEQIVGKEEMDEEVHDFVDKHVTGLSEQHHHHHHKHHKKPDIAERGMDEEVHGFATEILPPLNTRVRSDMPFIPNGSDPSAFKGAALHEHHHHHHGKNTDVAERKMDEEVYGFSNDNVSQVNEIEHSNRAPANNGKALSQHKMKAKDMGERGYDSEVFDMAHEMVSAINGQERSATPYDYNGGSNDWDSFAERKHHKHHQKKPDIAERGMDEEVHGFVKENLPPLNTRVRSDMPFIPNGSDASAFKGAASLNEQKHHKKPDIAERGMDEEVHGFATEILPPLNTRVRSDMPFIPNGSDPSAFQGAAFSENNHHHKHHKKDIAERGMDEEVHGFVWEALPPLNTRVRSTEAFIPNGSDPKAQDPSFAEKKHHKKDIAERGMDEEVHGFVWEALPPLNTRVRSTEAFIPNGSDPKAQDPSFAEKKHHKKDIAERGMDEEVHGFVWEALPPLNTRVRSSDAFIPNGSDPKAFDPSFAEESHHHHHKHHHKKNKRDVAERGMDEEVHGFVHEAIPPLNVRKRSDDAFIPNGSAIGDWNENAFAEREERPDIIGKGGWTDDEVQPFASSALPPLSEQWGSERPWVPNGSDASAHGSLSQKESSNINGKDDMDSGVESFSTGHLPPLSDQQGSDVTPWAPNGSDPSAHASLSQKENANINGQDGWPNQVESYSSSHLPPLLDQSGSDFNPAAPNGSDPSAHGSFSQRESKPDIIDEPGWSNKHVQPFSQNVLPPLSEQYGSEQAWVPNGSNPKAHSPSLAQDDYPSYNPYYYQPYYETGMNPNQYPYMNTMIPAMSDRPARLTDAPAPNGYLNAYAQGKQSLAETHPTDPYNWHAWERGMTPDSIYTYSSSAIPAMSDRQARLEVAPEPNGSLNKYSFAQTEKRDIAERGVESDYVHPFTTKMKIVEPTANDYLRPYLPYESNGGLNVYAQTDAAPHRDIANKEVRPDVWVTVHEMINPVALGRFREPRPNKPEAVRTWDDGPKPKEAPTPEFKFKKQEEPDEEEHKKKLAAAAEEGKEKAKKAKSEQAEEDEKPDEEAAGATPTKKEAEPEKAADKKKREADEAAEKKASDEFEKEEKAQEESKKKKEAEKGGKKEEKKKEALVQTASKGDKKDDDAPAAPSAPEKVHILEPTEYKEKADTNTPNIRTTFYDKKTKKAQI